MTALADKIYTQFVTRRVPCDMAAQAAGVALALACSNADDAEALPEDACGNGPCVLLTTITTVH